ncbi:hypothetical protein PRIC1_014238 [Phytophthora ramorum]
MPKLVVMSKFLPALLIPESDQTLLQELATTLVDHNLEQYNNLCVTKDGHPDSRLWTPTRKVEGIRIYREHPHTAGESPPAIPSLLLLGSVVGKLDDLMYGVVAPTDETLKLKSSCIRDGVRDSKVLEELVYPTVDDPFHHKTNNTVECYTRGFFDLSTDTHDSAILALQTIATQWLSFSRSMECAHMKKLAWRLRKNSDDADLVEFAPVQRKQKPKDRPADSTCRVCAKNFSFLPGRKKTCKSCDHAVCSRCCVKKLVCVVAPDQSSILEKKRTFCSRCIHEVVQSDAVAIAREELVTKRHDKDPVEFSL